ncbi:MAG: response regulator [bacterium]
MDILIIEDNSQVRELLGAQIACIAGVSRVRHAADGRAGLQAIAETSPDLLVLDLHLPLVNGFAVLDLLRVAGTQIPVIVMSSYGEYRAISIAKGARFFFDKATETDGLFATVTRMAAEPGIVAR